MQIRELKNTKQPGWEMLFIPEDTSTEAAQDSRFCRREGILGYIKCWLWIGVSISTALVIGRFLGN